MTPLTSEDLQRENRELRRRLEETEETIRALQAGEVDAVLVGSDREEVYTLEAADKSYRLLVEQIPQGAATLSEEGTILHCNRRFAELVGHPLNSLLSKPIDDYVAPDSRPLLATLLHNSRGGEAQAEVVLHRADGMSVAVYLGVTALNEGPLGRCLVITDLTAQEARKRTERLVQEYAARLAAARLFASIVTSSDDAIISTSLDGTIQIWNAAAERLFGYTTDEAVGRHISLIIPDDRTQEAKQMLARMLTGERVSHFDTVRVRSDGQLIPASLTVSPIKDDAGRIIGTSRIIRDISDRKQNEERIYRLMTQLHEADRHKDEFLATLAHELRNPLAPIRNAIQFLKAKGPPDPDLQWAGDVLDRQVQVMTRLLEELLDVSRISLNRLELRKERTTLAAVMEAALETSRPVIDAGAHELTVDLPAEPIPLEADPTRLAQVFSNLLNNAAKYTQEGGRIRVTAEAKGTDVIVSVKDSGIGIVPEMLPRVFDIFSQAQPTSEQTGGGLGIGLSLVKAVVELHGGSVEPHSDGPSRGSEFVVRLPVAAAPVAQEPLRPSESGEPAPVTKRRILIIDDNRDSADSLAKLLEMSGHQVSTGYDGEQAVTGAEALRPDVVLLDLGMPKVDGYEACRRIREQPWGQGVFLIALTGWGQEEDRRRTEEAGFNFHMVKPLDPAVLMKLLAPPSLEGGQSPRRRS